MKQKYIVCDVSLCHDCNDCFMACKDEHVDNEWLPYSKPQPRHGHRWMNIQRRERGQYPRIDVAYLPTPCQHCADPACVKENPDCISRREDGVVLIDLEKAQGKKNLADSCPYGAIQWNEEEKVCQKCTMCAHIFDGDSWERKEPRCVHSCPTEALKFYELEPAEMDKMIEEEGLEAYRPEKNGGKAGVYYKNLYRFEKMFIAGGLLKDGECAEGVEVRLVGAGQNQSQKTDYFGDFKFDDLVPGEYSITANGVEIKKIAAEESQNLGTIAI